MLKKTLLYLSCSTLIISSSLGFAAGQESFHHLGHHQKLASAKSIAKKEKSKAHEADIQKKTQTTSKNIDNDVSANVLMTQAKGAVLSVFNYNYENYKYKFKRTKKYFTHSGWAAFIKALEESNNLNEVKVGKMTVKGEISGDIKLLRQSVESGTKHWQLLVPCHVEYSNSKEKIEQNLNVEVTFIPVPKTDNLHGVAVTQFIAKLSKKKIDLDA